ncbi:MAG: pyruvate dehydrogenase complex dihydrolipoamide acetyltransferase [Bacteroidetes bacterium]|nr:MAG: pyruvate dehydrogenase complex dihydrolipoamide acetyltransferase [Bacteroidota bacterium]REK05165.1 MAG: pyruvate dehydrogenase complex dihydrolipoamide acetyltransferase [Bacteroidota bacterium]REK32570.1 MAG: pyruvate dehydrogenase complex dihydrolipoamide acetyltransferase [Bacteroidota bacterium]
MAEIVRMPKMSDTMTEGVLAKWHKKVGDTVKSGDLVAEIETDKATMEFESYQEGVLLYQGVEEGKAAPVDGILAILGKKGEDYKELLAAEEKKPKAEAVSAPVKDKSPEPVKTEKPAPAASPAPAAQKTIVQDHSAPSDTRLKASPLARKLAGERGINLGQVKGSGNHGRIVKRDIDWFKPGQFVSATGVSAAMTKESYEEVSVSQMRKTIARRLGESKFSAPHFYLTIEIDMEQAISAREGINAATGSKISYNDFVIKASARALREHPKVNSSWLGDTIRINHHVHIGVAVAVEEGLLVPVVRFADGKTLRQINSEVKTLAQKAKDKKLQPSDWEGNTFTISNLGMFGIDEFTAIINPPDACILAVGGIQEKPVVKNGQIVPGQIMKVTLSCDHRVVDGVTGAEFLNTFKMLMENPVILLGESSI